MKAVNAAPAIGPVRCPNADVQMVVAPFVNATGSLCAPGSRLSRTCQMPSCSTAYHFSNGPLAGIQLHLVPAIYIAASLFGAALPAGALAQAAITTDDRAAISAGMRCHVIGALPPAERFMRH